ncbi:unnamed protein product [Caenorhabditis angaria]|uniref:Uncharacterized protein n=1 Tax=Caenorhabditis angaria TaxID=860376 RepID=A0A9P1N7U3_9PELO|nr:unnamed protein product [Caenorhabditis angaria]
MRFIVFVTLFLIGSVASAPKYYQQIIANNNVFFIDHTKTYLFLGLEKVSKPFLTFGTLTPLSKNLFKFTPSATEIPTAEKTVRIGFDKDSKPIKFKIQKQQTGAANTAQDAPNGALYRVFEEVPGPISPPLSSNIIVVLDQAQTFTMSQHVNCPTPVTGSKTNQMIYLNKACTEVSITIGSTVTQLIRTTPLTAKIFKKIYPGTGLDTKKFVLIDNKKYLISGLTKASKSEKIGDFEYLSGDYSTLNLHHTASDSNDEKLTKASTGGNHEFTSIAGFGSSFAVYEELGEAPKTRGDIALLSDLRTYQIKTNDGCSTLQADTTKRYLKIDTCTKLKISVNNQDLTLIE